MKIQLITDDFTYFNNNIEISRLNKPKELDMFDINIIDLSYEILWRNKGINNETINCISDLSSIKRMLEISRKANNVIVLPQNCLFKYGDEFGYNGGYKYSIQLKDMINVLTRSIIAKLFELSSIAELVYGNSETCICDKKYVSAFVFKKTNIDYSVKTVSIGGGKPTTIIKDNLYITTLKLIDDPEDLMCFLKGIDLLTDDKEPYPEWLESYHILDDETQTKLIEEHKRKIEDLQHKIDLANERLEDNKKIKSILYTNGNQLVEQIFRILEKVLDCNLSEFIDEKKEDFLIQFQDVTFIGEIKGVTSNIKSENISQVDVHCQGYLDDLQEKGTSENVKEILIMNPFRNKPLEERTEVHENQIKLAERNNCLVIETITLLNLYEKVVNKEVSPSKVKEVFKNENGLLSIDSFDNH